MYAPSLGEAEETKKENNRKTKLTRVLMYDHRETVLDFTSYGERDVKVMTRKLTSFDNFIK